MAAPEDDDGDYQSGYACIVQADRHSHPCGASGGRATSQGADAPQPVQAAHHRTDPPGADHRPLQVEGDIDEHVRDRQHHQSDDQDSRRPGEPIAGNANA